MDVKEDNATNKYQILTGGNDSNLILWNDTTEHVKEEKRLEENEKILNNQ